MITISIDEKACVSCSLCVDFCPTKVFSFNSTRELPEVALPKECFGCLSCSEICPSDAIQHIGLALSGCFHHDIYCTNISSKLAVSEPARFEAIDSTSGLADAMQDISVRLLSVGAVLKDVIGAGLPSVGLMAGRALATQLPRYRPPKNPEEAFELARKEFAIAWELEFEQDADNLMIHVKECFVRGLCKKENIPLGGALCVLFFNYLSGYLGKMAKIQLKLVNADKSEESCRYDVKILHR